MMQQLGRSYVLRFNTTHNRTGTLWEGRFRSSIIDSEKYLFACYRYIELNPVRAKMVKNANEYRWSSFRANALGKTDEIVSPRKEWLDLGATMTERCEKYRSLFASCAENDDYDVIRSAMRNGLPAGSMSFREDVGAMLNERIGSGRRGRPPKQKGL